MANYIVSVKGFGDALIALSAMNAFSDSSNFRLISNKYISPLIEHLGELSNAEILPDTDNYPEHYNLRQSNPFRGLNSLLRFRQKLRSLTDAKESNFVFDFDGWREKFCVPVGANYIAASNMHKKNIYQSYVSALSEITREFPEIRQLKNFSTQQHYDVPIFFSSRVKAKELSISDLFFLREYTIGIGLNPRCICHQHDYVDLISKSGFQWEFYKSYADLDEILSTAAAVISSDSFPAHYAEYLGHKIFVIKNVENTYYLPYSAFISKHWSIGFKSSDLDLFFK